MTIAPRNNVSKMNAYVPPLEGRRSGESLLLDFNERTIPPSQEVKNALKEFAENGNLQIYPEYGPVTNELAKFLNIQSNHLMLANGSDNAIDTIMRCYLESGDKVLIPQPSFTMFAHSANLQGAQIVSANYTKAEGYPLAEVTKILSGGDIKICIICNPNNPTGTVLAQNAVEKLIKDFPKTMFLIDEAYYEFLQETSLPFALKYSNVVLTRTFSKAMGIPALRFGYVVALPEVLIELIKVRGPYAVNMMSVTAVLAALKNPAYVTAYANEVMTISKPEMESFYHKKGISFWPSGSNFHLIEPPISNLAAKLEAEKIKIRPMSYKGFEKTVRISIGTAKDTQLVIKALAKILS